jgi:hypothetical protein
MKDMKKIPLYISILASVFASFILSSCQSTKVVAADHSPSAVVSVYGNSSIPWFVDERDKTSESDGEGGGMLSGLVNRALGAHDPEIQTVQSRIDTAAEIFCTSLENKGKLAVVDHTIVEKTPAFKTNGNSFLDSVGDDVAATGYKIMSAGSSKRNKDIAKQAGAKSTIFVTFKFQKQKLNVTWGKTAVAARVTMDVYIANAAGHKIFKNQYYAVSPDSVPYENGKWDKEGLCNMFPDTITTVVNNFILDYAGESDAVETPVQNTATEAPAADVSAEATPIVIPASVQKPDAE